MSGVLVAEISVALGSGPRNAEEGAWTTGRGEISMKSSHCAGHDRTTLRPPSQWPPQHLRLPERSFVAIRCMHRHGPGSLSRQGWLRGLEESGKRWLKLRSSHLQRGRYSSAIMRVTQTGLIPFRSDAL